jgi:hypothetical protein
MGAIFLLVNCAQTFVSASRKKMKHHLPLFVLCCFVVCFIVSIDAKKETRHCQQCISACASLSSRMDRMMCKEHCKLKVCSYNGDVRRRRRRLSEPNPDHSLKRQLAKKKIVNYVSESDYNAPSSPPPGIYAVQCATGGPLEDYYNCKDWCYAQTERNSRWKFVFISQFSYTRGRCLCCGAVA